jgi:hypothetical protein
MSLFAGLTVIVKVKLPSLLSLLPVYIQVEALVFALCRSTRSKNGSGVAFTGFSNATYLLLASRSSREDRVPHIQQASARDLQSPGMFHRLGREGSSLQAKEYRDTRDKE